MSHRKPAKSYTIEQITAALAAKGIQFKIEGRQVNADLAGGGHFHVKITPARGLFLDAATSKGGTVASLFRQIGASAPATATEAQAPAISHPAEGGNQGRDTTDAAKKIWNAGWTCEHASDLPAGWEKGLASGKKGTVRAALEQQRDAVRAYIAARLGTDHLDHWSRQVRIGKDGLMLTPMHHAGRIIGIQRTYFDDAGQKTERKMLGRHGVHALTPPTGIAPRDLGIGKCVLIGTGWETSAAVVQSAGWPGIVTYSDGGLVKWAEQQAERAKTMTADQLAAAPSAVFLVDRDMSGAGQKAVARAVKILRSAGLKAYYAIPPTHEHGGPRGGPKGSDWGDYPREGIAADVLAAHLALALAHGDREMPRVEDLDADAESATLTPWRPSENPQAPAQSGPTQDVRAGLQTALQQTVADYLDWRKAKKLTEKDPFSPVLIAPTTGTGKSTAAKSLSRNLDLRMAGSRVCVFVPDHAQADEYEKENFLHFFGRQPTRDRCAAAFCPNYAQMSEAMENGHISQSEFCRQCSNGWARSAFQQNESEAGQKKFNEIVQRLRSRGINIYDIEPCN